MANRDPVQMLTLSDVTALRICEASEDEASLARITTHTSDAFSIAVAVVTPL